MQAQSDGPLCHRGPKQSVSPLKPIVPPCSASGTRPYMFTSWHTYLTFGDVHLRLHTSRPSRGALMRRHEGGAGPAPAGVVRSCTPGRTPEQPRRLLPGRLGSGHRRTRKREKPVARWTGAYLLLASALARHTPSFGGMEKETGSPAPDPSPGPA